MNCVYQKRSIIEANSTRIQDVNGNLLHILRMQSA